MNVIPGQTPEEILYAMLCDYYYWKTHPDLEEDGKWHRDEQCEAFADRVMEFIRKELSS